MKIFMWTYFFQQCYQSSRQQTQIALALHLGSPFTRAKHPQNISLLKMVKWEPHGKTFFSTFYKKRRFLFSIYFGCLFHRKNYTYVRRKAHKGRYCHFVNVEHEMHYIFDWINSVEWGKYSCMSEGSA